MASVGWERQYETKAVYDFARAVMMYAEEKPNDERLQAFARKCRMTALMLLTQEEKDCERGSIIRDRLSDCERCKRLNDSCKPCDGIDGHICFYNLPEARIRYIKRHFGDEGTHFIEWAGAIAAKREARACTQ